MSIEPTRSPEFNFWEFVCCAKCQLPFNTNGAGTTVPFWLTECGHVICNNHLNPDQTCAQCNSSAIQLIPLQLDMEPPMSDWFRSVPYSLDSAAYAVKFQQESMAFQIRNLKARHQKQRAYIEKLKQENAQLKQTIEMLTIQVNGMRDHIPQGEPAQFKNANGKRQMIDVSRHPLSSSSPRSIATPVGPNRITLPPGQQPPQLSSNQANSSNENVPFQHSQRPGTNRFTQQFAYTPAQEARMRPNQLSHTQAAPKQLHRALQADNQHASASQRSQSRMQPPPPVKPSAYPYTQVLHSRMGPPQLNRNASGHLQASSCSMDPSPNTKRYLPLSERFPPPPSTATTSKRFIPPATTHSNLRPATSSFPNAVLNAPSDRGQPKFSGGSGQRMPFIPE